MLRFLYTPANLFCLFPAGRHQAVQSLGMCPFPAAAGASQPVLYQTSNCACACVQEGIELSKAMDEPLDLPTRAAVGAGPTDEQILGSVPAQQVWHKVREHALAGGPLTM